MSSQTTIPDIHSLSVDQRVELMGVVWDSLISDGWRPPMSDEFRRRAEDDVAHPEKAVSWEEVKRVARGEG